MKKLDGMMLPVSVCADEGAKGDRAPAPSSSIDSGGDTGLTMRSSGLGGILLFTAAEVGSRRSMDAAIQYARPLRNPIAITAATARAMCAHKITRWSSVLPRTTR